MPHFIKMPVIYLKGSGHLFKSPFLTSETREVFLMLTCEFSVVSPGVCRVDRCSPRKLVSEAQAEVEVWVRP